MAKLSSEIKGLNEAIVGIDSKIDCLKNMSENCSKSLYKLDIHQKEVSMQLDTLSEVITDDSDTNLFIDSLISMAEQIENFYLFTQEDKQSELYKQSSMMWKAAKSNLDRTDIKVIDKCGVPLDSSMHLTEGTGFDPNLPTGYVIKILSCGYSYKGEAIKRAAVIINKNNTISESEKDEKENGCRD